MLACIIQGYFADPGVSRFLVALPSVRDLLLRAKHLFVEAMGAIIPAWEVSLLSRVGLTPEVIADPEERLIVQNQNHAFGRGADCLQDGCLGSRFRSARNRAALLRHSFFANPSYFPAQN